MRNTLNVIAKNNYIANEFIKYGTITPKRPNGYYMKKKSQATLQKEAFERKYTSRKNICEVCFQAKSLTGECCCN